MSDYSILVNSCDSYRDVWPFFFFLMKMNWPGIAEIPIYLNTEKEHFCAPDLSIKVINYEKTGGKWGDRLLNALSNVDSEFVVMMLEDFYYESPIRVDIINDCVNRMKRDKNILSFQFVPASEVYRKEVKPQKVVYPGFVLRERKGTYTFIAGPTLWRKSDLVSLTKKSDSPWDFEWYGSLRTQLYGKKIYCWESFDNPVFDYDIAHGGAVHGGKWVGYKMRELESKYNFKLDYGKREIVDDWIQNDEVPDVKCNKRNIMVKIIIPRIRILFDSFKRNGNIGYGLIMRIRNTLHE